MMTGGQLQRSLDAALKKLYLGKLCRNRLIISLSLPRVS
jgi:hypothetical protein